MTRNIPVHYLKEDSALDAEVVRLMPASERWNKLNSFDDHIDDCFTVIVVSKGFGTTDIDFRTVALSEGQLGIIAPGQVHSNIRVCDCEAWLLRIAPDMMDNDYRHLIDEYSVTGAPVTLSPAPMKILCDAMELLSQLLVPTDIIRSRSAVAFNMLNVILGIITPELIERQAGPHLRVTEIGMQFKRMLPEFVKMQKNPSFYANRLCISCAWLNEAVKKSTGLSPSRWINAAIILEAKRLLRSTSLTVKEVAHELGFEDHAYFSRLFKKSTGATPLEFRKQSLE